MARATLGSIVSRAHRLASVPEQTSGRTDALATQSDVIEEANSALGELHDLIVDANQDYLTVFTTVSMVASSNKTLLPNDFYKLRSIYALDSSQQRRKLKMFNIGDQSRYRVAESWDYPDYRIMNNYIYWLPLPSVARTVEIFYIRQFIPLENTNDELPPEIARGWEDFIVGHVAEWLLDVSELDPTPGRKKKEESRRRIQSSASRRNSAEPRKLPDVNNRYHGYRRRYRYDWPRS